MEIVAVPTENEDLQIVSVEEKQSNKRRRKKSIVWDYFTIETISPDCTRASCNQCKKSFAYITGSKLAGTSHLKRHIDMGICPVSRQKNQTSSLTPESKTPGSASTNDPPKRRYRMSPAFASFAFDQDRCNHEIAKMIILHDYPLHIVEHSGFIEFVRTLQPQFNMVSFNTIQGDCVAIYLREKQNLFNMISGIPGRVCITLDLWTNDQGLGYVFLTGHFVDAEWKLNHRVLNVVMVPSPDSNDALNQAVVACLSDWALEARLFTLTVDSSFTNETIVGNLRSLLSLKNPFVLNGQLLMGNCYARVLSRLAQDALEIMNETISKVRGCVKYVKTLESHEEKFLDLKQQLQVPSTRNLSIDDQKRWDTTYHMLVAACELKEVFNCLDASDPEYKQTVSMDEWNQVEIALIYLKLLHDAACVIAGPTYPPSCNFFHEVWKIQLELTHASMSQDPFISNLVKPLQGRFDYYWKESCLVLAIAVAMDPRFKLKLVEFSFSKIYGEDADTWVHLVDDGIHELYLDYVNPALPPHPNYAEDGNGTNMPMSHEGSAAAATADGLSDFDSYIIEITTSQQTKSELDQYLDESLLPRVADFDVLNWWKVNKLKYPKLSRMASDILSIPISTVFPDSVFDTRSKKMDSYRSSLRPVTLEALVCAKDWLQYGSSETNISNEVVKMEF